MVAWAVFIGRVHLWPARELFWFSLCVLVWLLLNEVSGLCCFAGDLVSVFLVLSMWFDVGHSRLIFSLVSVVQQWYWFPF